MNSGFTESEAQAAPREPIGSAPRKVRLSGNGVAAWAVASLLLAWAPFFIIWLSMQMQNRTELRQDGRVVVGEVTKQWSSGRGSVPFVGYTFTVAGTVFSGKAQMPPELFGSVRESGHILVRFLPANPTINHPDAWEGSVPSYLGQLLFMIICAITSSLIMTMLLKDRRLALKGVIAVGAVTSCIIQKGAWGATGFQIKCNFRTEDGRSIIGSDVSQSPREIGASVRVLYLPQNPGRNILFPSPYYIVADGSDAHA